MGHRRSDGAIERECLRELRALRSGCTDYSRLSTRVRDYEGGRLRRFLYRIDQIDIPPGDRCCDTAIEKALSSCSNCVVVVLSRASVESANVLDEVSFALDERKRSCSVLMEKCPVFRCDSVAPAVIDFSCPARAGTRALCLWPHSVAPRVSTGEQLPSTAGWIRRLAIRLPLEPKSGPAREYRSPRTDDNRDGRHRRVAASLHRRACRGHRRRNRYLCCIREPRVRVHDGYPSVTSGFRCSLSEFPGLSLTKESLGQSLAVAALSLAF